MNEIQRFTKLASLQWTTKTAGIAGAIVNAITKSPKGGLFRKGSQVTYDTRAKARAIAGARSKAKPAPDVLKYQRSERYQHIDARKNPEAYGSKRAPEALKEQYDYHRNISKQHVNLPG